MSWKGSWGGVWVWGVGTLDTFLVEGVDSWIVRCLHGRLMVDVIEMPLILPLF